MTLVQLKNIFSVVCW